MRSNGASPGAAPSGGELDALPPALRSMWRLCLIGYRNEPALMLVSFVLTLAAALPDALLALWFKFLGEGVTHHDATLVKVAMAGLAVSAGATWLLKTVSTRVQRRFRDRVTIALEAHVARLQATVPTIAHQERPEYLDRLSVLREQVYVLDHMYMSVFSTAGWILRLVVTIALLASISPVLILLVLFAIPTVATNAWRPGVERIAQEKGAPAERLARHLFTTATTSGPGKEVRVTGIGPRLAADRRTAWEGWYSLMAAARWRSALWHTGGWAVFGMGFVGAIVYVSSVINGSAAAVLLVLAAGSRLSAYVGATVGEIGFLRGVWMDGSRRLAWLEDYAEGLAAEEDLDVPQGLEEGIRFDHVTFYYPGSDRPALEDIDLLLPAGSVVAVVGENGAGKTTLVKLLSKLYQPTAGRILIDGDDLARMPGVEWRENLSGAYQDFFRFELVARHSVGLGDVPRHDDEPSVVAAVDRAGATDVVERLHGGLDTQLGQTWPGGVDLSFGQWQKLALSRGFMRDQPLLLVLDEPTAALDAETEHALFERYAVNARRRKENGGITVLVSHRFSTVRMADLIVVMDGARLVEYGSHDELLSAGGLYAELYGLQAAAYR